MSLCILSHTGTRCKMENDSELNVFFDMNTIASNEIEKENHLTPVTPVTPIKIDLDEIKREDSECSTVNLTIDLDKDCQNALLNNNFEE